MLQEREVLPVGADRAVAVDLRVVAATQRDLEQAIADDAFRDDLYARLCGYAIALPPLRERREDFGLLLAAIVPRLAQRAMSIAPLALRALLHYDWPYNVRELEQVLATAPSPSPSPAATRSSSRICHLGDRDISEEASPSVGEREKLVSLLEKHGGNLSAIARELQTSRSQVQRLLARHGLEDELAKRR